MNIFVVLQLGPMRAGLLVGAYQTALNLQVELGLDLHALTLGVIASPARRQDRKALLMKLLSYSGGCYVVSVYRETFHRIFKGALQKVEVRRQKHGEIGVTASMTRSENTRSIAGGFLDLAGPQCHRQLGALHCRFAA